ANVANSAATLNAKTGAITLTASANAAINALSFAASLAAGLGTSAGIALSGAGAVATNVILTKVHAYVQDSSLRSAGALTATATDSSSIRAKIVAASLAIGGGAGTGVAVSIGAAVAQNLIGWTEAGVKTPIEVQAYSKRSSIHAGAGIALTATSTQIIDALVVSTSAAVAGAGGVGVGASGSGATATNKIAASVLAYIDGDGATHITADGDVALSAHDTSTITAKAAGASLAASVAGVGVAVSIGISIARNDIANDVRASILGADVATGTGTGEVGGSIRLDAQEAATIDALSIAASLAAGFGVGFAIALSGAGAEATNVINDVVQSYVDASSVTAGGTGAANDVLITAGGNSSITAVVGAVAAAGAAGLVAAAGSVGASIARSLIGYSDAQDSSGLGNQVLAWIRDSVVMAARDVRVSATTTDRVSTVSFAGSVAVAAGFVAGAAAGAGVEATSKIATRVSAYVTDSAIVARRDVDVTATADSQITKSSAIGVAVAGASSVALTVSASLAKNVIADEVSAYVTTSADLLSSATPATLSAGDIVQVVAGSFAGGVFRYVGTTLTSPALATQNYADATRWTQIGVVVAGGHVSVIADVTHATIANVSAVTASVAVAASAAAGGGIDIRSTVDNGVSAYVSGPVTIISYAAQVASNGDTTIAAGEDARIEGQAVGVTVAAGVGVAIGVGLVTNVIRSTINAYADDATITALNIVIRATSIASIPTTIAIGVAGSLVAATGNSASATIATLVHAYALNADLAAAGDVSILATATSTARASADGGAFGGVGIGAMLASVTLGRGDGVDEVKASISSATHVAAQNLSITAVSVDDLLASAIAAAGAAIAATGATATTTTDQATLAEIGAGAVVDVAGLAIQSGHTQDVDASADSYAIALLMGTGASATNRNTTKANVAIGAATVHALNIVISAANQLSKDAYRDASNLRSGSASVGGLTVLKSETTLGTDAIPFQAVVAISSGALLSVDGSAASPGAFRIEALTDVTAIDSVRVESVSAYSITAALSLIAATTKAAIDVSGATLENKAGDLTLATRGVAHVRPSANLLIASALAGAAGATATGTTQATQAITVTDSTLKGTNVKLLAGRDGTGVPNIMDSNADVQITTISMFASLGIPLPSATIDEINSVTLAGTTKVLALQDVDLLAIHGATVAETDGLILSLSLVPYGAPALDGSSTSTSNSVAIGPAVSVEAGLNATVVVLIKPIGDAGFSGHQLGDELSAADKTALAAAGGPSIPADVKYEYAALNLSAITFTISTGTVVRVRSGANGGGTVDSYYVFRPVVASGVDIVLETENYADTSRWSLLTTSRVAASGTTPARPSIADVEASSQFYDSDVTKNLITALTGKFYVIKPKALDAPTLSYQNLGSLLFDQRQQIVDWIDSHATNTEAVARYTVQLQLLDQQLDTLGLTDVLVGVANANVVSHNGRLYRYIGATTAGSTDAIVLATADYSNSALWQDVTASNPAATYASNVKTCALCQRVVNRQLDGIFLSLPAIYAAPGSIFIQADDGDAGALPALAGSQLKARSQAKVTISNKSPFSMKVADVAILDSERVTVIDGNLVVLAPGNVFFNGAQLTATTPSACTTANPFAAACPTISISQDYVPGTSTVDVPAMDRDLYVLGSVVNETGGVSILNSDGSISVSGEILAQAVNIVSARDFTLNTEDWFHSNKDPRQYIDLSYQRSLAFALGSSKTILYASSTTVKSAATGGTTLAAARDADNTRILAQGRIAITARYLNINGLIQSGSQTITLHVSAAYNRGVRVNPGQTVVLNVADGQKYMYTGAAPADLVLSAQSYATDGANWTTISSFYAAQYGGGIFGTIFATLFAAVRQADYRSDFGGGSGGSFVDANNNPVPGISFGSEGVPVSGYFDADKHAVVVDDIVARGGEIVIAGQILSTGHGELKVAYGYTSVDIQNDSAYKLILNRIDTTTNRLGRITIVDTGLLTKTVFEMSATGVVESRYSGVLQTSTNITGGGDAVVTGIVYTLVSGYPANRGFATTLSYQPQIGLKYVWVEGQAKTTTTVTKFEKNSFNLFGDNGLADLLSADGGWEWRNVTFTDNRPLLESEVLACRTDASGCRIYSSVVGSPAYANSSEYTIEYVQKENQLVQVIGAVTIVQVGTGTATVKRYRHTGTATLNLLLPSETYTDTAQWTDVTSSTACTGTTGPTCYDSQYRNYSYTVDSWTTGGGWLRKKTVHTLITVVQGLKDYYTHTLKADYPIAISFVAGSATPSMTVRSVRDILLQGNLESPSAGSISLTSSAGSVTSAASVAIFGASPTVSAAGAVEITVEGVGSGSAKKALNVSAGGDITVNAVASAANTSRLLVARIVSSGGNVFVNARQGIAACATGSASCAGGMLIEGDRIELSATEGALGTHASPLLVNSSILNRGSGGLAARAEGAIFVVETTGDLLLLAPQKWAADAPVAAAGFARLMAAAQEPAGLASIDSGGVVELTTISGSILDANFEALRPKSEAEALAYQASLAAAFSSSTVVFPTSSIQYSLPVALTAYLYPQIVFPVGVSTAPATTERPNVIGSSVSLTVGGAGSQVGRLSGIQTISMAAGFAALSLAHQELLSRATVSSVLARSYSLYRYLGAAGSVNLSTADYTATGTWQKVSGDLAASHATIEGTVALSTGDIVSRLDSITVQLFDDVNVQGSVTDSNVPVVVVSAGDVSIESPSNLSIDSIRAGGNVNLVVTGNVIDTYATGTTAAITAFGNVTISSGGSVFGSAANTPLRIMLSTTSELNITAAGSLDVRQGSGSVTIAGVTKSISGLFVESATAGVDAHIVVDAGNLVLGTIAAGTSATLTATGGSILDGLANASQTPGNLLTTTATLAAGDAIGSAAKPLDVTISGELTATAVNDIHLHARGDANLATVSSTAGVVSISATGAIVDIEDDAAADIDALGALLVATTGVGSATNALETRISKLEAAVAGGGIWLHNSGSLTIGGVSALQGVSAATTIDLAAASPLIVSEDVDSTGGPILLVASEDVVVNAAIRSGGGTVTLRAGRDIVFGPTGSIDTETGSPTVTLVADADGSGGGAIAMADGSYIDARGGLITITATGDIVLGLIRTTTDVYVRSAAGSIRDNAGESIDLLDVVAANALLLSATGIGASANALELAVDRLEATGGAGGIFVAGLRGMQIGAIASGALPSAATTEGLLAAGDIVVSATGFMTVVEDIVSTAGSVTLQTIDSPATTAAGSVIPDDSGELATSADDGSAIDEDLQVLGDVALRAMNVLSLLAGDDLLIALLTTMLAGTQIRLRSDHDDADPLTGSRIDVLGSLTAPQIEIAGGRQGDVVYLHPVALDGHVVVLGDADGLPGGDDIVILDRLPDLDLAHKLVAGATGAAALVTGRETPRLRDTVDVDGRGGSDRVVVYVSGAADQIVNVSDTGGLGDGSDTLTINGGAADDVFLLRANFVARLRPVGESSSVFEAEYERINYDASVNVLEVNGNDGDDRFFSDDNSGLTTIDGGAGDDLFQVGQLFGSDRLAPSVASGDEIETVETTR
ncbi:MAG: hypothetical protein QOE31_1787, partial [Solirubrobacteraceae bacterium]|nr:hypothetical protein [Solirubrobacteraceae bacterium]